MRLTPANIRPWARSLGEEVTGYVGPHVLREVILHDHAWNCTHCKGWFSSRADMECADPETDTDRGECWFCRFGYAEAA